MKKINAIFIKSLYISILGTLLVVSCNLLDIEPENKILAKDALKDDQDIVALTNSIYTIVASPNYLGGRYQNISELLTDHLYSTPLGGDEATIYSRTLDFFTSTSNSLYSEMYLVNYRANTVLENLDIVQNQALKDNLEGQAKFLRAMAHFHTTSLYAQPYGYTSDNSHHGIPIKTKTELEQVERATVKQVYEQIISDLKGAEQKLPETNEGYPTKWSARGLLAKVYFQMNDFEKAVQYATDIIDNSGLSISDDAIRVGTKLYIKQYLHRFASGKNGFGENTGSDESLFTLISFNKYQGEDGKLKESYDNRGGSLVGRWDSDADNDPQFSLNDATYQLATELSSDNRRFWYRQKNDLNVLTKYDTNEISVPLILLTEIKLIRIESLAELDRDLSTAQSDLQDLYNRAYGGVLTAGSDASSLIKEARKQRELEFIGEGNWIHDLKRRGAKGEAIEIRNAPWNCGGMVLQFPNAEIANNPNLIPNKGGC